MAFNLPSGAGLSKPIVPLAVLLVAGLIGGAMIFNNQRQEISRLSQQLQQTRQQVAELESQNQDLTLQVEGLNQERQGLEGRVESLRSQLTLASEDLERSRAGLEELKTRADQLTAERTQLQERLAAVTGERDAGRADIARLEQSKADLERAALRLRERVALLDRDYRKLSEDIAQLRTAPLPTVNIVGSTDPLPSAPGGQSPGAALPPPIPQATVELPPIIVRKDQAGMTVPVRGRVVEVNAPHHFLVVDKGSTDGVRVGMAFDLVRGGNSVGRATVVRVRPQLSACDIVRAKTPGPVQSGDLAVQSGP